MEINALSLDANSFAFYSTNETKDLTEGYYVTIKGFYQMSEKNEDDVSERTLQRLSKKCCNITIGKTIMFRYVDMLWLLD